MWYSFLPRDGTDNAWRGTSGLHFLGLNGKQVQTRRMKTYAAFVAAKSAVLLCTGTVNARAVRGRRCWRMYYTTGETRY